MADRKDDKSPIRNILKVSRKTFINPTAWVDLDSIITQNKTIWSIFKSVITPLAAGEAETFEEVVNRNGLTEKDIHDGMITYRTLAFVFVVLASCCLFYMGYLVVKYGAFVSAILALAVAGLFFSQAFKYDFWAFQMRQRKLGLTVADWKQQYLGK